MPLHDRFLVLSASSLLAFGAAGADDRRPDPSRLTIATLNARFLFDGREPEGEAGFPWKGNAALAREHLREIAALVRALDADAVHISEVEDLATLERLVIETGDPTYRAYLVPGRDDFTRQNVGLISRVDPDGPLARTDEWASGPSGGAPEGVAKNYAARLTAGHFSVTLVGAHLLAFPLDPARASRREAQAEVLRRFALAEGPRRGRALIVLGDLNDHDREVPDAAGNVPITRVLETLRRADPAGSGDDLVNPAALLEPAMRFTAFHDRNGNGIDDGAAERSLTDHILVSSALAEDLEAVEVFPGHDPVAGPTDHFPLKVTLRPGGGRGRRAFLRGDATGDGRTDDGDVLAILRHLFEGSPAPCEDAADLDDDGAVSITDAILLAGRLHGGEPAPPPPGPGALGLDPTEDELGC
jgi:hypothetical protein